MDKKDKFILYHFPWLTAATLHYYESTHITNLDLQHPILDLGCGEGAFSNMTFDNQLEYGLDITLKNSSYISKTYHTFIEADITDNIPLDSSSVGTIVCNHVLGNVNGSIENVIKNVLRVLKPGGDLILTLPSAYSRDMSFISRIPLFWLKCDEWLNWYNAKLQIFHYLKPAEWKQLLVKNGFAIIECKAYVDRNAMFWHTLFTSIILLGMQLFPQLHLKIRRQKTEPIMNNNKSIFDRIYILIGKIWFRIFEKGYSASYSSLMDGGYIFIRCKKK